MSKNKGNYKYQPVGKQTKNAAPANKPLVDQKKKNLPYAWMAIIATVLVYVVSLVNGWIPNWDDGGYVLEYNVIQHINMANLKEIFTAFYKGNYHPLTTLFYAAEYSIVKDAPFLYHFNNLVFHALNVWLVFTFIRLITKRQEIAFICALFFGIHPMHVESVAWISERKDVLYSFFFLGSMIYYFYYLTKEENKIKYYVLSFLAFALSLLSKSAAVTLPVVLLLIDYYVKRQMNLKTIVEKLPFFALSLVFGVVAIFSQKEAGAIQDLTPLYTWAERPIIACYATLTYLWKFIVPINLQAMYDYPSKTNGLLPNIVYLSPVIIGVLLFLVYLSRKYTRDIIFGTLFFFVTISLVIQLLPVGGALVSERYSYIPYIGLFMILGRGWLYVSESTSKKVRRFKPVYQLLLIVGVIVFSILSVQRIRVWKDGKILFTDLINKTHMPFAYNNRGYFNLKYGEEYYKKQYFSNPKQMAMDSAFADFTRCISIDPTFSDAWSNRGVILYNVGKPEMAIEDFTKALSIKGNDKDAWIGRANSYSTIGKFDLALADYNHYIQLKNDNPEAYLWRGIAYYSLGKKEQAVSDYNRCISMAPTNGNAYLRRGMVSFEKKDYNSAIKDFDQTIRLNPNDAQGYSWRGFARTSLNQFKEAIADYSKALELNPNDARTFVNRCSAYADMKKYAQAFDDYCSAGKLGYPLDKSYFMQLKAFAGK